MATDPTVAAQAQVNQQKAALLAQMAQGAGAQQAAYSAGQQGVSTAKAQALDQALSDAAGRGAPAGLQSELAGTIGSRYDLVNAGLAAGAQSRAADMQTRQGAEGAFLSGIAGVLPILKARTDQSVADSNATAAQQRAAQQAQFEYQLKASAGDNQAKLDAIRLEIARAAQQAAAANQPTLAELRAQQGTQLLSDAEAQRKHRIAAAAQALKALGLDDPSQGPQTQALMDRASALLGRNPNSDDPKDTKPLPDTETAAKRRALIKQYQDYANEDPYASDLATARSTGLSLGADPAVLADLVSNQASYGNLQAQQVKATAPTDTLSLALSAYQQGKSVPEIADAMSQDGVDTTTQESILRIITGLQAQGG